MSNEVLIRRATPADVEIVAHHRAAMFLAMDRSTGQGGGLMTAEVGLKWLLRFISVTTLFALVAAVMPQSWLAHWIDKGAPGTSAGILVTYLARMLMIMYAFAGLVCLIASMDIPRYLPLIWILGVGSLALAPVGLIVLFSQVPADQRTGMFWIVFVDFAEGLVQAILMVALLLRIRHRAMPHAQTDVNRRRLSLWSR